MSWLIPKKYGYGHSGDDYYDFVWHYGRCHKSMLREIEARHLFEAARISGSTNTTVFGR